MSGQDLPGGARLIAVPNNEDERGSLLAMEFGSPLPFKPARTFVIKDVPAGRRRAGHTAPCDQFLWTAVGACQAEIRLGGAVARATLQGNSGLYLPKGVWIGLSDFSHDCVLVCTAAAGYIPHDQAGGSTDDSSS